MYSFCIITGNILIDRKRAREIARVPEKERYIVIHLIKWQIYSCSYNKWKKNISTICQITCLEIDSKCKAIKHLNLKKRNNRENCHFFI